MRSGFGSGVSIPSQLRWVGYVDWWTKNGKTYVDNPVEILEVHVWGLRDGVKVAIEGYVEEGKIIKTFHTFGKHERIEMGSAPSHEAETSKPQHHYQEKPLPLHESRARPAQISDSEHNDSEANTVMFRPTQPIILPTSDINIDFERRNKATYGLTMVTSVAHVWFNAFFELRQPSTSSQDTTPITSSEKVSHIDDCVSNSGVFQIDWEAMDGIKGSARKGTRALDRLVVVWRTVPNPQVGLINVITQPAPGDAVAETKAADWTKANVESSDAVSKDLGLRVQSPSSANISRASSPFNGENNSPKSGDCVPEDIGATDQGSKSSLSNLQHVQSSLSPDSAQEHAVDDLDIEKVQVSPHSS